MSVPVSVELLNGETLVIDVWPETTMRQLKQRIKEVRVFADSLSRDTTLVELMLGDMKVDGDATVARLPDARLSAVLSQNVARCSHRQALKDLDPDTLVVVDFPEKKKIGAAAFRECLSVAKVIIPSSVLIIGLDAFRGCSSLASVTIPDSVSHIMDRAFFSCRGLKSVFIPNSVIRIGCSAFGHCSSLSSVVIPDSVRHLEHSVFASCTSLSSIALPDSIICIAYKAFFCCSSLTSIIIPDSVEYIGCGAFSGCSSLVHVSIPDSATRIEAFAFASCSSLTSVTIPDSVLQVGDQAFAGCKLLTLRAPARLLHGATGANAVPEECGCGRCEPRWFARGWMCPVHLRRPQAVWRPKEMDQRCFKVGQDVVSSQYWS